MAQTISSQEARNWVIYKITSPTGRVYIGKASDFATRKAAYRNVGPAIREQRVIYNSLLKYGFDKHTIEIIDSFNGNSNYSSGKEIFWIRSFMSNGNKWPEMRGMNLTNGGEGALGAKFPNRVSPMKGKKMTEAQRARIRAATIARNAPPPMQGRKHTQKSKDKMSKSKKGMVSIFLGKKHTESSKQKNREAHLGKPSWNKGKNTWSDEDKKRIGDSKKGNVYMKGKIHTEESKRKMSASRKGKGGKKIIQYDLNNNYIREYNTIQEASDFLKIKYGLIMRVLYGGRPHTHKLIFKYK